MSDVEEELIAKELAECVRAFLRTQPARECDIFLRRYFLQSRSRRYPRDTELLRITHPSYSAGPETS